jgi:hypothetical protein
MTKIKLVLMLAFVPCVLNTLQAQEKVRVAIRAGLYFSRFKFSDLPVEYSKPKGDDAFYAGLQIDIPVSKKISIVGEGLYALSSVQSYDDLPNQLYVDNMEHILIPVLIKFKAGKFGFFGGGQAEWLLSATGTYVENSTFIVGDIKENSYRKFGFSGVLGAEFVFKYRFGIDARYQIGLGDARASNGSSMLSQYGAIKTHAFQTGLFFRFGRKPRKENS